MTQAKIKSNGDFNTGSPAGGREELQASLDRAWREKFDRLLEFRIPSDSMETLKKKLKEACAACGVGDENVDDACRVLLGQAKVSNINLDSDAPTSRDVGHEFKKATTEIPIEWPTETYSQAYRERGCNIIEFLEEKYINLIKANILTRKNLRDHDETAAMAIANYVRGGRQLPEHLYIPTKKEINDKLLGQGEGATLREVQRLGSAAQRRVRAMRISDPQ